MWFTWSAQPIALATDDVIVKVLDGLAVVHMVRPTNGASYKQYAVISYLSLPTLKFDIATRRNIYGTSTLMTTPKPRLKQYFIPGLTIIIEDSTPVPRDWNKFLSNSRNKVFINVSFRSCYQGIVSVQRCYSFLHV